MPALRRPRGAAWRQRARLRLLQMHSRARVGHSGGNLSALDLLLALFHDVMTDDDQFVLSKGHAAGAMYIAAWTIGRLTDADHRAVSSRRDPTERASATSRNR